MNYIHMIIMVYLTLVLTDTGEARRRSKKIGFTFGANVISKNSQSQMDPNASAKNTITDAVDSYGYAPHVGYNFGTIGLGLRYTSKIEESIYLERDNGSSNQDKQFKKLLEANDTSIYARINFGVILYLETGIGYYTQSTSTDNKTTTDSNQAKFEGERNQFTQKGSGLGYHSAFGFEVPVGHNFFFTGCVMMINYEIKNDKKGESYKQDLGQYKNRDLNFGFSYYFK